MNNKWYRIGSVLFVVLIVASGLSLVCILCQPSDLSIALGELEADAATFAQMRILAWDAVATTLDRAWEATWDSDVAPPPTTITDHHQCWHISEFDGQVDDMPFEVWRCEFTGFVCDPHSDELCIDLGGDGVHWEFRFKDEEIGTFYIS